MAQMRYLLMPLGGLAAPYVGEVLWLVPEPTTLAQIARFETGLLRAAGIDIRKVR